MKFYLLQYYNDNGGLTLSQKVIIAVIILGLYSLIRGSMMLKNVLSHWHHRFDEIPFSPQDFYTGVKDALKAKEMNHVSLYTVVYREGGLLSPNREYLRVHYKNFLYDICAAPFAKGFFVSWWLGETGNAFRDFFLNLPVVGKFFERRKKTFFELDTEVMFKEMVTSCVKETIEQLTKNKGIRQLSESDWKEYIKAY